MYRHLQVYSCIIYHGFMVYTRTRLTRTCTYRFTGTIKVKVKVKVKVVVQLYRLFRYLYRKSDFFDSLFC